MSLITPVIEIPRNQERRMRRHNLFDTRSQCIELTPPRSRKQRKMNADTMHRLAQPIDCERTVQQATLLESKVRYVLIVLIQDGKA